MDPHSTKDAARPDSSSDVDIAIQRPLTLSACKELHAAVPPSEILVSAGTETDGGPTGPLLVEGSGGGGGRRYDFSYWIWPLPPPGPVTFVCQWPAYRIEELRAEIDAQRILDAAARSVDLWPDDSPTTGEQR